jgi:hypothetical protein
MPRTLLIFVFILPLAVLMGFMLADPLMSTNMAFIGGVLFALMLPIALAAHHRALIWLSGAYMNAFFLPGQPYMWMIMAFFSFGISVLSRPLARNKLKPIWPRSVAMPLIFILGVVVVTALLTGGIGLKVLGSQVFGGRKYLLILGAVVGFFALTFQAVPRKNALRDTSAFCLAPLTACVSNIAYMLGPAFYFLFLLFPVELALNQASANVAPVLVGVKRISGFGPAAIGLGMFVLMRFGIRGLLDFSRPLRFVFFCSIVFLGWLSGFRSAFATIGVVFIVQFFAEGLHRTRFAMIFVAGGLMIYGFLFTFATSLPLAAQRAISFLPITIDRTAALDAQGSWEWRLEMWNIVAKEIPQYLWLGKGYVVDPGDLALADEAVRRGFASSYDIFIKVGDYHSGPLSVLIPFGILGALGFIWFVSAAIRVLWNNMRYGEAELKQINTFLFSLFLGRLIFFTFFFGGLELDLWLFASIVGFNISLNSGVKKAPEMPRIQYDPRRLRGREEMLATI